MRPRLGSVGHADDRLGGRRRRDHRPDGAARGELRVLRLSTVDELVDGDPAAGRARRAGARRGRGVRGGAGRPAVRRRPRRLADAVRRLETARPTAVNLARGARRAAARLPDGPDAVLAEALALRDEEIAASAAMATPRRRPVRPSCAAPRPRRADPLQHRRARHGRRRHGARAWSPSCTGAARSAASIASETRPLLQGARLTAWELGRLGVDFRVAVDGAGPVPDGPRRGRRRHRRRRPDLRQRRRDQQDRHVRARARRAPRPASRSWWSRRSPRWTPTTPTGADVEIEDRDGAEVVAGGAGAVNPAFDVTPHDLVTAIVTDRRVRSAGRTAVTVGRSARDGGDPAAGPPEPQQRVRPGGDVQRLARLRRPGGPGGVAGREPRPERGDRVGRRREPSARRPAPAARRPARPERRPRCRRTSPRSGRAGSRPPGCRPGTSRRRASPRAGRRRCGSRGRRPADAVRGRWRPPPGRAPRPWPAPPARRGSVTSSASVQPVGAVCVTPASRHSTQAQPWNRSRVGRGEAGGLPAGHRMAADEAGQAVVAPVQALVDEHLHRPLDRGDVGDQAGVAGAGELVEHPGHGRQRHRDDDEVGAGATASRTFAVTCQRAVAAPGRRRCAPSPGSPGRRRSRAPGARRRRGRAASSRR